MPFEINDVHDEDFPKFVPSLFGAMGGYSNFVNALYPDNLTAEGQQKAIQRFKMQKKLDPTVKWCKVIDTDTNEIVGVAQWTVIQDMKPLEEDIDGPPGTWPNEESKQYCQALYKSFMERRRKLFRENDLPFIGAL